MIDPIALESSIRPYDPKYRVYVRDEATLERIGEVDDFVAFDTVLRLNEASTWILNIPRDSPAAVLLDLGAGIIVLRGDQVIVSGPVRAVSDDITPDGTMREVSGIDDTGLLGDRLALPVPTGPPYTAAEYDVFSGTAEDAMRYFVDRNAGEGATEVRRIPRLIAGTFQGIGRPIAFRSSKTTGWHLDTSVNAHRPHGAIEGDTILALLQGDRDNLEFDPPDQSWTRLMTTVYGTRTAEVWWKRLGSREPSGYRWRFNRTSDGYCGLSAWSGVHPTNPTDGYAFQVETNTTDPATPSITTTTANTQIAVFYAKHEGNDLEEPTDFSRRYDVSNIMAADAPKDAIGPTGAKVASSHNVNSDDYAAFIVALRADNTTATDQISAQGRFDNLLELTQSIAIQGGNLRFVIKQVGTDRTFGVERINDLSDTIIFSQELGTLIAVGHEREGPLGNYVYAGGGGEGTQREFVERGDATTLEAYWRTEVFVDKRSQTGAELGQAIDEEIEKGTPHVGFALEPVDTDVIRFGRDYELGDTVTVVIDGTAYAATVREASLHIDADGAVVTPTISPTASIGISRGFSVGRLSQRLSNIERNAEGFTLGMGMLWSREPEFIPSGWGLCDGTLGTVDMRGRFAIGADPSNAAGRGDYNLGETGGASSYDLQHNHSGPSHNHGADTGTAGTAETGFGGGGNTASGGAASTDNDGGGTTNNAGGGNTGSGGAASTDNDSGGSTGSGGAASTDNDGGGSTNSGGTASTDNDGAFSGNTGDDGDFSGNTGGGGGFTTSIPVSGQRSVTDTGSAQVNVADADHEHSESNHDHSLNIPLHDHSISIGSHDHAIANHAHTVTSHDHPIQSHDHSTPSHDHPIQLHNHTVTSHDHVVTSHDHPIQPHVHAGTTHTHSGPSHNHGISADGTGNTGNALTTTQNTIPPFAAWHYIQRTAS